MTRSERTKREKYETSRPYDEIEKVDLIAHALHEVFVTIPAVQLSAERSLRELGAMTTEIEFSTPDEEEIVEGTPNHSINMEASTAADLRRRFEEFKATLAS